MDKDLKIKFENLDTSIALLRRDIDKFRLDFIRVLNKLDKLEK